MFNTFLLYNTCTHIKLIITSFRKEESIKIQNKKKDCLNKGDKSNDSFKITLKPG